MNHNKADSGERLLEVRFQSTQSTDSRCPVTILVAGRRMRALRVRLVADLKLGVLSRAHPGTVTGLPRGELPACIRYRKVCAPPVPPLFCTRTNGTTSYVYYSQVMQAECLAAAFRVWRRNWKGPGREYTSGALVWQMNDCWPVTSWAIVDYFLRPKPAYFAIARELRPFTVGLNRTTEKIFKDDGSAAFFTIEHTLEIWGTNSMLEDKEVYLDVVTFDLESKDWRDGLKRQKVVLKKNSATELYKGPLPGQPTRKKESEVPKPIVVSARLLDVESGEVLGRCSNWWVAFRLPIDTLPYPPLLGFLWIRCGLGFFSVIVGPRTSPLTPFGRAEGEGRDHDSGGRISISRAAAVTAPPRHPPFFSPFIKILL